MIERSAPLNNIREMKHLLNVAILCLLLLFAGAEVGNCAETQKVTLDVATDRVGYQPGGRAKLSVSASHTEEDTIVGRLIVEVYSDVDTRFPIIGEPVSIKPGKTLRRTLAWTMPDDELWGCHVTARFEQDGKTVASGRQVFVVSDNLVKAAANLAYISPGYFKTRLKDPVAYAYDRFYKHAVPIVHISCWAPSNWGTVFPQTDSWICGQMRYRVSLDDVDLMVRHAKQRGMFTVTYGRITLEGLAGYRWAKENPEKVWYRKPDGKVTPLSADELRQWEAAESNPKTSAVDLRKLKRWSMVPKLNDNTVLDDGIDQYLKAIERFEFDGIRWDWHPGFYHHPHLNWLLQIGSGGAVNTKYYDHSGRLDVVDAPDEENVRIIRRWKRRMLAARPELALGYNLQVMNSVYPDNEEINPPPTRAYSEMIRDAMIIDEKHFVNLAPGRTAGMHREWPKTLKFWSKGNDRVRRYGGYHYTGGHPNLGADAFIQHAYSLSYACGARATSVVAPNVKHKPWYRELVTFAQRYAMYLFHPSLHPLMAPDDGNFPSRYSIKASRPIEWKEFGHTITDRGHFTLVAQLWNRPVKEQMNVNKCDEPPPVEKSTVHFTQPIDLPHEKARAYALSYEWPGWVRPIEIDSTAKDVTIEVPPFRYWAVVLLQYPTQ
ncbi:MAG: hypothetical protein CMJ78_04355 [Planctomycetaceae bacterium]|nr:hypothetical protein [Planctomycetaceae bacterium]